MHPPSSSGSEGNVATAPIEAKNLDISDQNDNSDIDNDGIEQMLLYLRMFSCMCEFVYVCVCRCVCVCVGGGRSYALAIHVCICMSIAYTAESEVVMTPSMEKCPDNTKPSLPEKAAAIAAALSNNTNVLPPGKNILAQISYSISDVLSLCFAAISASPTQQQPRLLPNCRVYPTGKQLGFGSYGEVLEVEYKGKKYMQPRNIDMQSRLNCSVSLVGNMKFWLQSDTQTLCRILAYVNWMLMDRVS